MRPTKKEFITVFVLLIGLLCIFLWKPLLLNYSMISSDIPYFGDAIWKPYVPTGYGDRPLNFLLGDQSLSFYPWSYYAAEQLKSGHIPLWNPYSSSGVPLLANLQSAVLDPVRFLLLQFVPIYRVPVFQNFIRLFLLGIFTYLYARKLKLSHYAGIFSMVAFTFSGFIIDWLGHPHIGVACWLPALFLLTEEWLTSGKNKYLLGFSFVLGLQFLGGHIETSTHLVLMVSVYFSFRWLCKRDIYPFKSRLSPWFYFGGAGLMGFLLAAVQLFPFLEYVRNTSLYLTRQITSSGHQGSNLFIGDLSYFKHSLPALLTAFFPNINGNPIHHDYNFNQYFDTNFSEQAIYFGIIPLLLAIFASVHSLRKRDKLPLFFMVLGTISIGMAIKAPVFNIINHLPGFNITLNGRFRLIYTFCGALLSGYGIDLLMGDSAETRKQVKNLLYFLIGFLVLFTVMYIVFKLSIHHLYFVSFLHFSSMKYYLFGVLLLLVFTFFLYRRILTLKHYKLIVLVVVVIELFYTGMGYNVSFPKQDVFPSVEPIQFLQSHLENNRVVGIKASLSPALNLFFHIPDIRGCDPMRPYWNDEFITKRFNVDYLWFTFVYIRQLDSNAIDFMNIKYILSEEPIGQEWSKLKLVYQNPKVFIYENPTFLPRAFFASPLPKNSLLLSDSTQQVIPITDKPWGLTKQEHTLIAQVQPNREYPAKIIDYTTGKVIIETQSNDSGYLILSDTYYPGWKATCDGQSVSILCANQAFRAIPITKGTHQVVFEYKPLSFRLGVIFSGITLILWVLLFSLTSRYGGGGIRRHPSPVN